VPRTSSGSIPEAAATTRPPRSFLRRKRNAKCSSGKSGAPRGMAGRGANCGARASASWPTELRRWRHQKRATRPKNTWRVCAKSLTGHYDLDLVLYEGNVMFALGTAPGIDSQPRPQPFWRSRAVCRTVRAVTRRPNSRSFVSVAGVQKTYLFCTSCRRNRLPHAAGVSKSLNAWRDTRTRKPRGFTTGAMMTSASGKWRGLGFNQDCGCTAPRASSKAFNGRLSAARPRRPSLRLPMTLR
jgi:hypothetical protein